MARGTTSKHGRTRAWLAPAGVAPVGVGSIRKGDTHGGAAPFGDNASRQGRRLRAQRPFAHRGSDAWCKGGRPWARRPLDEGRRGELGFPFGERTILSLSFQEILRTVHVYRILKMPSTILEISRNILSSRIMKIPLIILEILSMS
ncbi:hypothetical protein BHE74_00038307 [Ensete ventricosum]|nr:hypothetical protein BHE74_00038307 [Ensete ventricosum]